MDPAVRVVADAVVGDGLEGRRIRPSAWALRSGADASLATVGNGRLAGADAGPPAVGMDPLERALVPSLETGLATGDPAVGAAVEVGAGLASSFY